MKSNKLHRIGSYKKNQNSTGNLISFGFYWYLKAEEFKRAAEVLYEQICIDQLTLDHKVKTNTLDYSKRIPSSLWPTYVLMLAFALENLFKGLILHQQPNLILGNKLTGPHFKNHNLVNLAADCQFKISELELRLCDIGSEFIKGYGRYPMSKDYREQINSLHIHISNTRETFLTLYTRLSEHMQATGALTKPDGTQGVL